MGGKKKTKREDKRDSKDIEELTINTFVEISIFLIFVHSHICVACLCWVLIKTTFVVDVTQR